MASLGLWHCTPSWMDRGQLPRGGLTLGVLGEALGSPRCNHHSAFPKAELGTGITAAGCPSLLPGCVVN